jgi:hypothetical protein
LAVYIWQWKGLKMKGVFCHWLISYNPPSKGLPTRHLGSCYIQIFMARTTYFSLRCCWCPLCARPTPLVEIQFRGRFILILGYEFCSLLKTLLWLKFRSRTVIKTLFLYLIVCLSVMLDSMSCSFTFIFFLTNIYTMVQGFSFSNLESKSYTCRECGTHQPRYPLWSMVMICIF